MKATFFMRMRQKSRMETRTQNIP